MNLPFHKRLKGLGLRAHPERQQRCPVRKRSKELAHVAWLSLLPTFQPGPQPTGQCHPHSEQVFPTPTTALSGSALKTHLETCSTNFMSVSQSNQDKNQLQLLQKQVPRHRAKSRKNRIVQEGFLELWAASSSPVCPVHPCSELGRPGLSGCSATLLCQTKPGMTLRFLCPA